jgi:hypothetical protein
MKSSLGVLLAAVLYGHATAGAQSASEVVVYTSVDDGLRAQLQSNLPRRPGSKSA